MQRHNWVLMGPDLNKMLKPLVVYGKLDRNRFTVDLYYGKNRNGFTVDLY